MILECLFRFQLRFRGACLKFAVSFAITLACFSGSLRAQVPTYSSGKLAPGTQWETPWYITDSQVAGPTVLVVGGIHGNEPAGFRAAEQVRTWPITKGKLVVIPKANRLGLAANLRWLPAFRNDAKQKDLNRNFQKNKAAEPLTPIAIAIWEFIAAQKPEWVFDLHEGFDFHCLNPKSVGSSVIAFPDQSDFAKSVLNAVNKEVKTDRQFDLLDKSGPVNGSLARACRIMLGANSFIFETTFKNQAISTRARQHRTMVSTALQKIGMISESCVDRLMAKLPFDKSDQKSISVGVFDGAGSSPKKLIAIYDADGHTTVMHLGPNDMKLEILHQFDVLVFPGGSGSKQATAIGATGRKQIRAFSKNGGGVIGICAGAYFCSSDYSWSLHLVNAKVFNESFDIPGKGRKSMWYRGGAADVDVEVLGSAKEVLGDKGTYSIRYQNGPIFAPDDKRHLPPYRTLAYFRSENGIYEPQKGTMVGAPAVVESRHGKGKVLAISPHFESTQGQAAVIIKATQYVTQGSNSLKE